MQEMGPTWVQFLGQEDPQRRQWQSTPVFLPGKFHGERGLSGYSPWGCKELDMTEWLSTPEGHYGKGKASVKFREHGSGTLIPTSVSIGETSFLPKKKTNKQKTHQKTWYTPRQESISRSREWLTILNLRSMQIKHRRKMWSFKKVAKRVRCNNNNREGRNPLQRWF